MVGKGIKVGVVGLGKMGLSHFAMVNAHPLVEAVACDGSGFMVDVLSKNISTPVYKDYDEMMARETPQALVIATPSRLHAPMVRKALEADAHVFCEKPFCLDWQDSMALTEMAATRQRVAQVGYHYRYVGAFEEMKRLIDAGAIGDVTHVLAEAYGPVVLRPKRSTWRSDKAEGGGCLYDYAAHPLNLLNWFFGVPARVSGSVLNSVFSESIDDEVFSTLQWDNGPTAHLTVNWSDESHRKMSTKISLIGTNGRISADRQEIQVYLRKPVEGLDDYVGGWNVKYTTELTRDRWFYLRGEEYSGQLDEFFKAIANDETAARENGFASASETDKTLAMIIENADTSLAVGTAPVRKAPQTQVRRSWFGEIVMDKLLFGDNQFFGINHMSEEKARAQAMRFQKTDAIMEVLDTAYDAGIKTFMCTTHDRIFEIADRVRANPDRYADFTFYPCMPYAHKYANAVTDHGMVGALRSFMPDDGLFATALSGAKAIATKEVDGISKVLIDMEMKMFRGLKAPVVFVQNVFTDLLLGMGFTRALRLFDDHIREKYDAEPAYITMNMPMLLDALEKEGIERPIICSNINKIGFRMSGGFDAYLDALQSGRVRAVAMSVYASGAIPADEAIHWISELPGVESIVFGASSARNIHGTKELVDKYMGADA